MNNFFKLMFGNYYLKILSLIIKFALLIRGIYVGKNFTCDKFPRIILIGKKNNIRIFNNVVFFGEVELRCYNGSTIEIGNNCKIDKEVRIISANASKVKIESEAEIGAYSILNCGSNLKIGGKTMISSNVLIQLSEHKTNKNFYIKHQGNEYRAMNIGEDVLIGSKTSILMGANIGRGSIIGASSLVKSTVGEYEIHVGIPSKKIGYRK